MQNSDITPMLPSPEDRRRAVNAAFKNSKWASKALQEPTLTDEQKSQQRLEAATIKIFEVCREVKTRDIEQGGEYNEDAMARLAMSMWMDFTQSEGREALRFMLATVCTGAMLEAIKEL